MAHEPTTPMRLDSRLEQQAAHAHSALSLRTLLRQLHLWLGMPLGLLLVVVSLSGSALVLRDGFERWLNPGRYAVTGSAVALPLSRYVGAAMEATGKSQLPVRLVMPQQQAQPLVVVMRGVSADGRPSRFVTAWLDPATARVLDLADAGSGLMGTIHSIHHMLSLPQLSGRQIVGWLGVVLMLLATSGLILWWPRTNRLSHAVRWRRSSQLTYNLHHMLGVVIASPLLAVCLTGVYLSFPQTAAAGMSAFAPLSGARVHGFSAVPLQTPKQRIDEVARRAAEVAPGAKVIAIHAPVAPRGHGHDHHAGPAWRIELGTSLHDHMTTVTLDDDSGMATVMPQAEAGDRAVKWIEWIHGGRRGDPVWPMLAVASGLAPLVFFVTGITMWIRRRRGPPARTKPAQRETGQ